MLNKKKRFNRSGFTLMETLVTLVILVLLVLGMDAGINSGMRVYDDATFYADSRTLAAMVDTTLGDLFRYSQWIHPEEDLYDIMGQSIPYVFTNADYATKDAYVECVPGRTPDLRLRSAENASLDYALLNSGAFPKLKIKDFAYEYNPEDSVYTVHFVITSQDESKTYDAGQYRYLVLNPA